MAKSAGGVRGNSRGSRSVLGLRNQIGQDSAILRYTGHGNEYGQIGLMSNGRYYGVFGGVKGSTGGLRPQRKEFNTEREALAWMKKYGFVP